MISYPLRSSRGREFIACRRTGDHGGGLESPASEV